MYTPFLSSRCRHNVGTSNRLCCGDHESREMIDHDEYVMFYPINEFDRTHYIECDDTEENWGIERQLSSRSVSITQTLTQYDGPTVFCGLGTQANPRKPVANKVKKPENFGYAGESTREPAKSPREQPKVGDGVASSHVGVSTAPQLRLRTVATAPIHIGNASHFVPRRELLTEMVR